MFCIVEDHGDGAISAIERREFGHDAIEGVDGEVDRQGCAGGAEGGERFP